MTHDMVILGGGCGGLWLLHELCPSYRCLLVERQELGRYASTRNQSWLHSGALYSVFLAHNELRRTVSVSTGALDRLAQECRRASEELRNFCPEAFEEDSECLFLFETKEEAIKAAERIATLGLRADMVNPKEIIAREPLLSPLATCQHGLVTQDVPFDSYRILSKLVQEARASGAEFHMTPRNLCELTITFNSGLWRIREDDKIVAETPIIIFATGALTQTMMQYILKSNTALTLNKCHVAVLHDRICDRIVAFRSQRAQDLNLVPFEGGTTVNLGAIDRKTTDVNDDLFHSDFYQNFAETLDQFVPGLKLKSCQANFYVCQKLSNTEDSSHPASEFGTRHYFWLTGRDNSFFLYPGKFTLAQVAARAFVESLKVHRKPELSKRGLLQSMSPPDIAKRPYYDRATHVLHVSETGELEFEDVRG
jgi:glycine/D-amino acid oxidase-like deaminating enzyme